MAVFKSACRIGQKTEGHCQNRRPVVGGVILIPAIRRMWTGRACVDHEPSPREAWHVVDGRRQKRVAVRAMRDLVRTRKGIVSKHPGCGFRTATPAGHMGSEVAGITAQAGDPAPHQLRERLEGLHRAPHLPCACSRSVVYRRHSNASAGRPRGPGVRRGGDRRGMAAWLGLQPAGQRPPSGP